jgi:hypothetical protein
MVGVVVFAKMKNEFLYPEPLQESDKIENKPVPEQRRRWWACIYFTVLGWCIGSVIMWFLGSFLEMSYSKTMNKLGSLAIICSFFLLQSAFNLFKLRDK